MKKTIDVTPLTVVAELSPEMIVILDALCDFYHKERWQVIELALEQLATQARLITETINAKGKDKTAYFKQE